MDARSRVSQLPKLPLGFLSHQRAPSTIAYKLRFMVAHRDLHSERKMLKRRTEQTDQEWWKG